MTNITTIDDGPTPLGLMPDCVLLVEDNIIILMDTEEILRELGTETVLTATGTREAMAHIDARRPDIALLDIDLGIDTCFEVAARLDELQVPFVFVTGYGDNAELPPAFTAKPRLMKPHAAEALRSVLTQARISR